MTRALALLVVALSVAGAAWGTCRSTCCTPTTTTTLATSTTTTTSAGTTTTAASTTTTTVTTTTVTTTTAASTTTTGTTTSTTTTTASGIACVELTHGTSTAVQTSYTTASVTPVANHLLWVITASECDATCAADIPPTPSGDVTWDSGDDTIWGTNFQLAMTNGISASPSTGAITLTYAHAQTHVAWAVVSCSGTVWDDSNNNTGTGTAASVTLGGAPITGDAIVAAFAGAVPASFTPGSGYTTLSTDVLANFVLAVEWRSTAQATANGTWNTSVPWGAVMTETGP